MTALALALGVAVLAGFVSALARYLDRRQAALLAAHAETQALIRALARSVGVWGSHD